MYGQNTVSVPPQPQAAAAPTLGSIQQETIKELHVLADSFDNLLAKVRGSQPADVSKNPEEVPTVIGDAHKISILVLNLRYRLNELHSIIG
jgi:hypothetical protein